MSSIETIEDDLEIKPAKRHNQFPTYNFNEKKAKLYTTESDLICTQDWLNNSQDLFDAPDLTQQLIHNSKQKYDEDDESLQNTLDDFDFNTQLIKDLDTKGNDENSNKFNKSPNCTKAEFDAFKQCVNSESLNNDVGTKDTAKVICGTSSTGESPSNICQVLKDSELMQQINCTFTDSEHEQSPIQLFKVPEVIEKIRSLKKEINRRNPNNSFLDKTDLFNNKNITNDYRTEVDSLFDHIGESICIMGTEACSSSREISDEILDVIINKEAVLDKSDNKMEKTGANWSDDSFSLTLNSSIGTTIKNAMLMNASKDVSLPHCSNMDLSVAEVQSEFHELGPFFGMPLKVKELIKQYKGINELYGELLN